MRSTEVQTRLSPGSASLGARLLRGLGRAHAGDAALEESEEFLPERISLSRSLQCRKAHSPWPALSTQSQGDGAVPAGSPLELPNLPKPN